MPRKQKLSFEEKVKIIRGYLKESIGIYEVAQRGGVERKIMYQWVRNYEADGVEAFLPHKNRVYSPELKKQAWRMGAIVVRKTKLPVLNWKKSKLKLSSSNTNYIWPKWRML